MGNKGPHSGFLGNARDMGGSQDPLLLSMSPLPTPSCLTSISENQHEVVNDEDSIRMDRCAENTSNEKNEEANGYDNKFNDTSNTSESTHHAHNNSELMHESPPPYI